MERVVRCLLCGHPEHIVRFRGPDRMHGFDEEFTLVECTRCQFIYLSPRPDSRELRRYYPCDYVCYSPPLHEEHSIFRRLDRLNGLRARCNLIAKRQSGGHLLDVGCATGDFLSVMRTFPNWEVRGVEMDESAVQVARRAYDLAVDVGTLESVPYPDVSFDAITMWDVLEHLPRPLEALESIHRLLRTDGLLVCGLPNRDSFDALIFGRYWAGLDIPRHLSIFSKDDLLRVLKQTGFQDPEVIFLSGSVHSFLLSMRFWINDLPVPDFARNIAIRILDLPVTRMALLPYMTGLRLLRRGATFIIIARKV